MSRRKKEEVTEENQLPENAQVESQEVTENNPVVAEGTAEPATNEENKPVEENHNEEANATDNEPSTENNESTEEDTENKDEENQKQAEEDEAIDEEISLDSDAEVLDSRVVILEHTFDKKVREVSTYEIYTQGKMIIVKDKNGNQLCTFLTDISTAMKLTIARMFPISRRAKGTTYTWKKL